MLKNIKQMMIKTLSLFDNFTVSFVRILDYSQRTIKSH